MVSMPGWHCVKASRNVLSGLEKVHVKLRVPVKRRRALVATNPIEE
jgi:hypothetical protein